MPFGVLAAKQRQYFANAVRSTPTVEAFYEWLLREGRDTEAVDGRLVAVDEVGNSQSLAMASYSTRLFAF